MSSERLHPVEADQAIMGAPLAEESERAGITHEEIADRAYALYEAGEEGTDLHHWLRAERELLAERGSHAGQ